MTDPIRSRCNDRHELGKTQTRWKIQHDYATPSNPKSCKINWVVIRVEQRVWWWCVVPFRFRVKCSAQPSHHCWNHQDQLNPPPSICPHLDPFIACHIPPYTTSNSCRCQSRSRAYRAIYVPIPPNYTLSF